MWYNKIHQYLEDNLDCDDAAHDITHCERVTRRALNLAANTDGDLHRDVLIAAGLLHDIVNVLKILINDHKDLLYQLIKQWKF